jgi:hypothetical protein
LQKNSFTENLATKDTVATATTPLLEYQTDTLTKTSKSFSLNGLKCYWNHFLTIYDYGNDSYGLDILMKLIESESEKLLLQYEFSPQYAEYYNYKSENYFDTIQKTHFTDMNFDGLTDFHIYEYGSMPMTSATVIYLFNKETKQFEYSDLSDTIIEDQDSIQKILTTSSWNRESNLIKKYHFDDTGKIKFTELFTEIYEENPVQSDDTTFQMVHYQKIINNEIVEERTDRVKID